jgi:N-ethylmaleimide reductase
MVMSPMTRFRVSEAGVPSELNAIYYRQRAAAGLLIGEGTYVEPRGRITPRTSGLYTAEQVAAWRAISDEVHDAAGRMFIQLCHGGRASHGRLQPDGAQPVAPSAISTGSLIRIQEDESSGVKKVEAPVPRALETAEIPGIVEEFRAATRRAEAAGFDGVELHAGSGLLHQQFMTPAANVRIDRYGGDPVNRCRFVIETLEAMSEVRGPGRIGVKIAPTFAYHGTHMEMDDVIGTYSYLARELSRLDLAYLHVQFPPWGMFIGPRDFDVIGFIRGHYRGTLMGAGEFDRHTGEAALADGKCDLVAFGRRFIANPDLPERVRRDAPENTWDEATLYSPLAEGLIDYPALD